MKRSADQWRVRLSDHVAFFSYRWLAWAVAALALTLPGHAEEHLPRDAGLLLLIGVINVVITALAQGYARLLRQRPILFILDVAAVAAVLWLSGSRLLPFLPYALGALILPALALGWRGALVASISFVMLDLIGLTLINPTELALSQPALIARAITPIAFACTWTALGRVLPRMANADRTGVAGRVTGNTDAPTRSSHPGQRSSQPLRLADLSRPEPGVATQSNFTSTAPLVLTRVTADQHIDPARRMMYDLTPTAEVSLALALEQIGAVATSQGGLDVQVVCIGEPRSLHAAYQSVLLRTAQEALLNVRQHARAHSAHLTLTYEPHTVRLEIQDDGVGLLDGTYERPGLHALRAIRYRLAELDGHLAVFEGENGGVIVRASLPLE